MEMLVDKVHFTDFSRLYSRLDRPAWFCRTRQRPSLFFDSFPICKSIYIKWLQKKEREGTPQQHTHTKKDRCVLSRNPCSVTGFTMRSAKRGLRRLNWVFLAASGLEEEKWPNCCFYWARRLGEEQHKKKKSIRISFSASVENITRGYSSTRDDDLALWY